MAAITVTRGRENVKPGHRVFRGMGTWNSTDTTGTLGGLPKGNVIGARFTPVFASGTATAYCIDGTPTNGVLSCAGSLALKRAAGTDSAGTFFFEIEYDSQ